MSRSTGDAGFVTLAWAAHKGWKVLFLLKVILSHKTGCRADLALNTH